MGAPVRTRRAPRREGGQVSLQQDVRGARGFGPDPERSATLPARYYYDPEIYEREK